MSADTSILQRVRRFFFAHEPMYHPRWELVIMRFVLVLLVWDMHSNWSGSYRDPLRALQIAVTNPVHMDFTESSQPHPNGLATVFDLTFLTNDMYEMPLRLLTGVSLLLYLVGMPSAFTLIIPIFFCIGVATLQNSQGFIGHTSQAAHVVLLSVWLGGVWSLWCKRKGNPLAYGFTTGQFEADLARQAVAAAYVVSAISKLLFSQGGWISSARYLPLHIVKNCDMEYYDTIKPAALKLDWLPQVLMERPVLCMVLFGAALPLELFAFVGLYNRRTAALFGIGLIAFHESVTQLMNLSFIFNKALLLAFFVAPWWWLAQVRLPKAGSPVMPNRLKE